MSRRIMAIHLGADELHTILPLLWNKDARMPDGFTYDVMIPSRFGYRDCVPPDAIVLRVEMLQGSLAYLIILEHESFDEVPDGHAIPTFPRRKTRS